MGSPHSAAGTEHRLMVETQLPASLRGGLAELGLARARPGAAGALPHTPCLEAGCLPPARSEPLLSCLGFCLLLMTPFRMLKQLCPEKNVSIDSMILTPCTLILVVKSYSQCCLFLSHSPRSGRKGGIK